MKRYRIIYSISVLLLSLICLQVRGEVDGALPSPISAFKTLLDAQNKTDLKLALTVARGEAAKTIAPSFAGSSGLALQFDTTNLVVKESKVDGDFRILTVEVSAQKGGKSRAKEMQVVAFSSGGAWLITFVDDELSPLDRKKYESLEAVPLETVEKEFEVWKSRFAEIRKKSS